MGDFSSSGGRGTGAFSQQSSQQPSEQANLRLILALRDLGDTIRALYEGRGSQRRVLIVLYKTGPVTQRELTARLGIQPGSASEVIAKLEGQGLLRRTVSAADRRTADITLTAEGESRAREALEQRLRRHREMFAVLTDAEKEELFCLLDKLRRDWTVRYGARTAAPKEKMEVRHVEV